MKYINNLQKIFLLILVITVIYILYTKFYNCKEGLDQYEQNEEREKTFLENQELLFFNKIYSPELIQNNALGREIEKCRILNINKNCAELPGTKCGYCKKTNTFLYGNEQGVLGADGAPLTDVCVGNDWVKPGPNTQYYCTKDKERKICKNVKDCGDVKGEQSICGWCPTTQSGMVKKQGENGIFVPKYNNDSLLDIDISDNCIWDVGGQTADVKQYLVPSSDKCAAFNQRYPCMGPKALTGAHSGACMQNLFEKGGCTTLYGEVTPEKGDDPTKWTKTGWEGEISDFPDYSSKNKLNSDTIDPVTLQVNSSPFNTILDYFRGIYNDITGHNGHFKKVKNMVKYCNGDASANNLDPCDFKYEGNYRIDECLDKLYEETNCEADGLVNPKKFRWKGSTDYFTIESDDLLTKEFKTTTARKGTDDSYKTTINSIREEANNYSSSALLADPLKMDNALKAHYKCYGKLKFGTGNDQTIGIPNAYLEKYKDCWEDFVLKMTTIPGINDEISNNAGKSNIQLEIKNDAPSGFKNVQWPFTFKGSKYQSNGRKITVITEQDFAKEDDNEEKENYFPFWSYRRLILDYWTWERFKQKFDGMPYVKIESTRIIIKPKSELHKINDISSQSGNIGTSGNNKIINKLTFDGKETNDFPFWSYINIIDNNSRKSNDINDYKQKFYTWSRVSKHYYKGVKSAVGPYDCKMACDDEDMCSAWEMCERGRGCGQGCYLFKDLPNNFMSEPNNVSSNKLYAGKKK